MNDEDWQPTPEQHFQFIYALLSDEELQNSTLHEFLRMQINLGSNANANLRLDDSFGWKEENPIPVNGPLGERTYLSRLRTQDGVPFFFHRVGSTGGTIDVYEIASFDNTFSGELFLDMYHPNRCKAAPKGLLLSDDVSPFTGDTLRVDNFPVGLIAAIDRLPDETLRDCHIPREILEAVLKNGGWI